MMLGTCSCTRNQIRACSSDPPPCLMAGLTILRTGDWLADRQSTRAHGGRALSEMDMETPGEDAAEQAREVPEEEAGELRELPFEVNEADAAEQVRDIGYDDEDYR
jgi:hypothetical protein